MSIKPIDELKLRLVNGHVLVGQDFEDILDSTSIVFGTAPSRPFAAGVKGTTLYDSNNPNYLYLCIAENVWARVQIYGDWEWLSSSSSSSSIDSSSSSNSSSSSIDSSSSSSSESSSSSSSTSSSSLDSSSSSSMSSSSSSSLDSSSSTSSGSSFSS